MQITITPVRAAPDGAPIQVTKSGDTLLLDGEEFDFSALPDGATLLADDIPSDYIVGDVQRVNGEITLKLISYYGPNAPETSKIEDVLDVQDDGDIEMPIFDVPEEQEEQEEQEV